MCNPGGYDVPWPGVAHDSRCLQHTVARVPSEEIDVRIRRIGWKVLS